jgi:hypothetical protein
MSVAYHHLQLPPRITAAAAATRSYEFHNPADNNSTLHINIATSDLPAPALPAGWLAPGTAAL